VATALAVSIALGGCGNGDEERRVVDVLEQARDHLLAGDGRAACARMTARAQRKVLQLPGEGYTDTARNPRPPRGCVQVIERVSADSREHQAATSGLAIVEEADWRRAAPEAEFEVTDVADDRATVEIEGTDPPVRIHLRKVGGAWLIDDEEGIILPGD
jgi:hypothetical protein